MTRRARIDSITGTLRDLADAGGEFPWDEAVCKRPADPELAELAQRHANAIYQCRAKQDWLPGDLVNVHFLSVLNANIAREQYTLDQEGMIIDRTMGNGAVNKVTNPRVAALQSFQSRALSYNRALGLHAIAPGKTPNATVRATAVNVQKLAHIKGHLLGDDDSNLLAQ